MSDEYKFIDSGLVLESINGPLQLIDAQTGELATLEQIRNAGKIDLAIVIGQLDPNVREVKP